MKNGEGNEFLLQLLILIFQKRGLVWVHFLLAVVITPLPALPRFVLKRKVDPASPLCSPQGLELRTEKSLPLRTKT